MTLLTIAMILLISVLLDKEPSGSMLVTELGMLEGLALECFMIDYINTFCEWYEGSYKIKLDRRAKFLSYEIAFATYYYGAYLLILVLKYFIV
jgi:hypothetical protein